jgi:phenylalanyl-tRNA synthetase beta chain
MACESHPNADKLSVCRVDIGGNESLQIVCGAPNVRAGGQYPVALEGARVAGGLQISRTRLRGTESAGMLCSAAELGLAAESDGLLELSPDWRPGEDVAGLLALDDQVLDVSVTPNRADCMSIRGLAREVAAAAGMQLNRQPVESVTATSNSTFPLRVSSPDDCPRFVARVLTGLDSTSRTPLWLSEKLRRCGVRSIHPVVDVTNFVMLDMGQPMHAYDLNSVQRELVVRRGTSGEALELLDGRLIEVDAEVLVIADSGRAIGLAGIMGGKGTAVSASTTAVMLESAYFAPAAVRGRARRFGFQTDASQRFERGVDPELQAEAVERATRLILSICGGVCGPRLDIGNAPTAGRPVDLRRARLGRLLGVQMSDATVTHCLRSVGMSVQSGESGWQVRSPSWRYDIEREEDLVEEVARLSGYSGIPETAGSLPTALASCTEHAVSTSRLRSVLVDRGYFEAITYSFVDAATDAAFGPSGDPGLTLSNPISADLSVMRRSLWPGLTGAARYNLDRQRSRIRMFEIGSRFLPEPTGHIEEPLIAGIVCGDYWPEQWGSKARPVDLFDVKADLEAIFGLTGTATEFRFEVGAQRALHPARTARIRRVDAEIGWIGELHPRIARHMGLPEKIILFELRLNEVRRATPARLREISRFPSVRRDLAVVVKEDVPVGDLLDTARTVASEWLRDAFAFDIYTGGQVGSGQKSVAIGLILQDTSRTLMEAEIETQTNRIATALREKFNATIRDQ